MQDETKALCAEYGIVLLFIPEFKGTKIYGATHWYMGKPIIQLSLRQKSNDHLWFSFFHELKHVLSHSPKRKYINNNHDISSKEEREANLFASEILIPTENYNQFIRMRKFGVNDIREFAQHLGVHPGIVVGRLQHDKIIPYSHRALNRFKVRYTF